MNKYPREELPERSPATSATATGYDYHHHAEVGSSNAGFVTDEIIDRFCVLGDAPRRTSTKLRALADAGVDQFNLYLMNGDEEEQLELYGARVIPALATWRPSAADACHYRPFGRSPVPRRDAARSGQSHAIPVPAPCRVQPREGRVDARSSASAP